MRRGLRDYIHCSPKNHISPFVDQISSGLDSLIMLFSILLSCSRIIVTEIFEVYLLVVMSCLCLYLDYNSAEVYILLCYVKVNIPILGSVLFLFFWQFLSGLHGL